MRPELIESVTEAVQNAIEFNKLKKGYKTDTLRLFSMFYHWYYFPHLEIFAPSKFIGYKNTTVDNYYDTVVQCGGDGGMTQNLFKRKDWFVKIEQSDKDFNCLRSKLEEYGRILGKMICKKTFKKTDKWSGAIYVLSKDYHDNKIDL